MAVLGEDFTRSVARALGVTDEDRAEWDSMEEAKLKRMEKQGVSKRAELAKPGIEYGDKVVDSNLRAAQQSERDAHLQSRSKVTMTETRESTRFTGPGYGEDPVDDDPEMEF